jgi:hypothetical protein
MRWSCGRRRARLDSSADGDRWHAASLRLALPAAHDLIERLTAAGLGRAEDGWDQ